MYQQFVTHRNRTAIILVIDGSVSMKGRMRINSQPMPMSEVAAMVANFIIDELVERARRNKRVRNYYDIAAIGYSGDGIESLLPGDGSGLISVERLAEYMPTAKDIRRRAEDTRGSVCLRTLPTTLVDRAQG